MPYRHPFGVIAITILACVFGCQHPPKESASAQKAEAAKRYAGPAAARQPKQRPAELGLEPGIPPAAGGPTVRELQQKLDLALKEKADAEQASERIRKALDETRAAEVGDRKALEDARARLSELQSEKGKPESRGRPALRDEDTLQKLLELAREFYDRNDFATARRILQDLADLGYENGVMFFMLGRSCQEMEDWNAAISNYGKAYDAFQNVEPKPPAYVRALINWGVVLRAQRQYKDAEEVYRKAIKADPKYPSTYYNLGLLYEECLHDDTKAVAAYEKYIDLRGEKYEEIQERVKRLREMGKPQPK